MAFASILCRSRRAGFTGKYAGASFHWGNWQAAIAVRPGALGRNRRAIAGSPHRHARRQCAHRWRQARRVDLRVRQVCFARPCRRALFDDDVSRRNPTVDQSTSRTPATIGQQQKLPPYRVNALRKSTEGNYVVSALRQNGTSAPAKVNRSGFAGPAAPAPPWPPRRPCPSGPGRRAPGPGPRSRPSGCRCRWRCRPSSAP